MKSAQRLGKTLGESSLGIVLKQTILIQLKSMDEELHSLRLEFTQQQDSSAKALQQAEASTSTAQAEITALRKEVTAQFPVCFAPT